MKTIQGLLDDARYCRNVTDQQEKAFRVCDRILSMDQENRNAMLVKAGALQALGREEEFLALVGQITKKWPKHWEAYYLLGMHHFAFGRDAEAAELLQRSVELEGRFDNLVTYAQILYLAGRDDYLGYLEKVKRIDPERAENFMRSHWVWDMESVQPTLLERIRLRRALRKR